MTDQNAALADTPASASLQPLFYQNPQLLHGELHASWRLREGDAAFAADTPYVPIVASEIAAAARSYPIVFSAKDIQPVAILGLERRNLFVSDGQWADDAYIPAYVRRYPFGFIATVNPDGFALAIDADADRVVPTGDEGAALFEDGKPAEITRQALAFCDAFQGDAMATRAFGEALKARDLLVDRRADATLPDGRKLGLDGFQIVDAAKFGELADDVVLDWHRKGWLALVHFHFASLERFQFLLARQAAAQPVAAMSRASGSAAQAVSAPGAVPAKDSKAKKVAS